MMSVLGDAKKGMRPGGTWPAMADTRRRKGHFSPHYDETTLGTLFDYVVGSGVLTTLLQGSVTRLALVLWLART